MFIHVLSISLLILFPSSNPAKNPATQDSSVLETLWPFECLAASQADVQAKTDAINTSVKHV